MPGTVDGSGGWRAVLNGEELGQGAELDWVKWYVDCHISNELNLAYGSYKAINERAATQPFAPQFSVQIREARASLDNCLSKTTGTTPSVGNRERV
jgi:hypothetical protein